MLEIIIAFTSLSLLFYCLFAGADFGGGIIEVFSSRKDEEQVISRAMGPVWEANHIWLILLIVILFNGFPKIYSVVSVSLHIPLLLMLIGIIIRGCAFTFRHYDAFKDSSQKYYTKLFHISSIWTPLFLGIIIGTVTSGRIDPASTGYYDTYIRPWLNIYSVSVGIFACTLFAYLAAVYLLGESQNEIHKKAFRKRAFYSYLAVSIWGFVVFTCAEIEKLDLLSLFLSSKISILCLVLETAAIPVVFYALKRSLTFIAKAAAGFQVIMVISAYFILFFPSVLRFSDNTSLTFYNSSAPPSTLFYLAISLILGSIFILPALYYLIRKFKFNNN
jgi:cytochrome d ubiquinol oxidase subunit II